MAFLLTPLAQQDLEIIWNYTTKTWGLEQAKDYFLQIEACLTKLNLSPDLARRCDDIRQGYRKYLIGKHVIFLKIIGQDIQVIRILPSRMDFDIFFNL